VLQVSMRNWVFCLSAGRKMITVCAPDAFAPDSNEATQKLEQQLLMLLQRLLLLLPLLPGLLLLLLVFLLREQTAAARARAAQKSASSKREAEKHTRDASR